MDIVETLHETDAVRIVAVWDLDNEAPYDDGQSPIIVYERGASTAQESRCTSYVASPGLVAAWDRWATRHETFERYARMFHDARVFAYRDTRDASFVTCDPADWRATVGITDEMTTDPNYVATFGVYGAWLDGETYALLRQERCDHDGWHTTDALGGIYGSDGDYLRESAADMWPDDLRAETVAPRASAMVASGYGYRIGE